VALLSSRGPDLLAQEVQFRPRAGLYLPTKVSLHHGTLRLRQTVGVSLGAQLVLRFNERFDLFTGLTYIPAHATIRHTGDGLDLGAQSHRLAVATGANYRLLPRERPLSWVVRTGLGLEFGGGQTLEHLPRTSTLTGLVSTTLRLRVGRILTIDARIRDRFYRAEFGGAVARGRRHKAFQVSFGLGVPLLGLGP
jgi:hypothetical protein